MDDWAKDHLFILGTAIIAILVLIFRLYSIFKKCCQNPKTERRSEPTVKYIYCNQAKPEAHKCPICSEIPLSPKILLKCSNGHSLCNQCLTSFKILMKWILKKYWRSFGKPTGKTLIECCEINDIDHSNCDCFSMNYLSRVSDIGTKSGDASS